MSPWQEAILLTHDFSRFLFLNKFGESDLAAILWKSRKFLMVEISTSTPQTPHPHQPSRTDWVKTFLFPSSLAVGPNSNKSKQVFSQREYATIAMATGATLFLMSIVMLVINIHLRRRWYKAALRARCSHAEKLSNLTVPSLFESPHGSLQMEELLNRYDIDISTYDRRTSLKYAHRPNPSAKP